MMTELPEPTAVSALGVRHVPDVERVEGHESLALVAGEGVAAVALVRRHLAPRHQAEEPLLRVHVRLQNSFNTDCSYRQP